MPDAPQNRPTAAREESANVKLAESIKPLLGRAFTVSAEVSGRADGKLPDLAIEYGDLRIVLEAKYDDFDGAIEAAHNRWHALRPRPDMVGAVSYSPRYRTDFEGAIRAAEKVTFALSGDPRHDLHYARRRGEIYDLAQALRRPYSVLARDDDRIEGAVNRIRGALAFFVDAVENYPGMAASLAALLQAGANGERRDVFAQSARMAGLIVFGAALFQIALAKQTTEVQPPHKTLKAAGVRGLEKHWQYIVEEINYHAIFRLAADILALDVSKRAVAHLIDAAREVEDIAHDGIDLMGRVYHQLLADAKTLGAFYTTIPAATLMAGLALHATIGATPIGRALSRSASCASPTRPAAPAPCWLRPRGSWWTTSRARTSAATAAASAAKCARPARATLPAAAGGIDLGLRHFGVRRASHRRDFGFDFAANRLQARAYLPHDYRRDRARHRGRQFGNVGGHDADFSARGAHRERRHRADSAAGCVHHESAVCARHAGQ